MMHECMRGYAKNGGAARRRVSTIPEKTLGVVKMAPTRAKVKRVTDMVKFCYFFGLLIVKSYPAYPLSSRYIVNPRTKMTYIILQRMISGLNLGQS